MSRYDPEHPDVCYWHGQPYDLDPIDGMQVCRECDAERDTSTEVQGNPNTTPPPRGPGHDALCGMLALLGLGLILSRRGRDRR